MTGGIASAVLALATAVALISPASLASAVTLPNGPPAGWIADDAGTTHFVAPTPTGCTSGVDKFTNFYYGQGWTVIPSGVHHALVSAVGQAGSAGVNGGAAGGLGGGVSAIVPVSPGEYLYASPNASPTQDYTAQSSGNVWANGGDASFVSTIAPTTLLPVSNPGFPNPSSFCTTDPDFGTGIYRTVMPAPDLVVVAGGGGGGGPNAGNGQGGVGGNAGPNGSAGAASGDALGGGGGTQSAGGAGAAPPEDGGGAGQAGGYLWGGAVGGLSTDHAVNFGGGGGAGYYGGGSGGVSVARGGGGGGSNYVMSLPSDGLSAVISNGTSTATPQVSIVPIYEPTATISAPVNPSATNTATTIVVTVSGLPVTNESRPGAAGTVSLRINGSITQTQGLDTLVGADTGVRTATFTVSQSTAETDAISAIYNGDTSQQSATFYSDIVEPANSNQILEQYKANLVTTVSGSMQYGDSSATFTSSQSLPSGVTISGTASCTTADGGKSLSTLSGGSHTVDPSSCSGLTLGGTNAGTYVLTYAGSVTVSPAVITATITGSQSASGVTSFADTISPLALAGKVSGTPTCSTLQGGAPISPGLSRGIYTLGTCSGLTLLAADATNYSLVLSPGQFVAGTGTATVTIDSLAGAVVASPIATGVTIVGDAHPTGHITLQIFNNSTCSDSPVFAQSKTVDDSNDYSTGSFTPGQAGSFSAQAVYTGDNFNPAVTTPCASVSIGKADAGVTFSLPSTGQVGQPLSVSGTFSSPAPRTGGNFSVILFPPADTTCTGNVALVNNVVAVNSDGVLTSPSYVPTAAGIYHWVVIYAGDSNHSNKFLICEPTEVDGAPTVSSSDAATFAAGSFGMFTITTNAGIPAGTSLSETGALPSGVTFADNGDGTATLAGTPGALTGGSYPLTITAANSATSSTQNFVLTVTQSPAFSSADTSTFSTGDNSTFTVTTDAGFPTTTTIGEGGALPAGVSFVDNGNGTATLSGTPDAGTGGNYPITLTAGNGTPPNATQSFTLTVRQPVALDSTAQATFQVGQHASYTATTVAGFPAAATLSLGGTLPSGLTFTDNGDGSATVAGTPDAATGGVYALTISASNGVGVAAVQNLQLTVNEAPKISSTNNVTLTVGTREVFTVTTNAGYPSSVALGESGALPAGVSFVDNGNGTATLSGTPAAATGGVYPIAITASNGTSPDASQHFTVTVDQPVAIDGTDQATFQVGQHGSHALATTTGYPSATTLTLDGSLPSGLSFTDAHDGSGSIQGTPDAGTGGVYPVTITADNGIGTDPVQNLSITVNEAPAITSANHWTATLGVSSTFDVTSAAGYPVPYTLSASGTVPAGLSISISGGTATIGGVPSGTAGDYPITLTASNGTAIDTVQTLTISVANAAAVPLPPTVPVGAPTLDGVPATTHPAQSFTASTTGFAPGAPITWGIYSSGRVLTTSVADGAGNASATVTIPSEFSGVHTLIAAGIAPDGTPLYVTATTTVVARTTAAGLPTTGADPGAAPLLGGLLLLLGLSVLVAQRARRARNG